MGKIEDLRAWPEIEPEGDTPEDDQPPPIEEDGDGELPPDCPVVPLGKLGTVCHYLDANGQHIELALRDHSRSHLIGLYGALTDVAWRNFPRLKQDKDTGEWIVVGFRPELCADRFMAACARRGIWSPLNRMRGAGAWTGERGELILHCGDKLLIADPEGGQWREEAPGLVGDKVYPTAPANRRPFPAPQGGGADGPGAKVLELLKSWHWKRGELDAYLMLGFIGAAMLGGAAKWRATVWVSGSKGSGKSTMQECLGWLFGPDGLLQSPDATAASVRQTLGYATLPVLIDEAEPEPGQTGRGMDALIKLARNAATGALALRGGQNHVASSFVVRSNFLFSSILVPPLSPQDRSRIAVLELDLLGDRQLPRGLTERAMGELGRKLLRRMVDGWGRLEDTLHAYRAAMAVAGYSARAQDVYGTLLAAADLLLHDALPFSDDEGGVEAWVRKLGESDVLAREAEDTAENQCLGYLLSSPFEAPHNRQRLPIGAWLMRAIGRMDGLDADGRALVKRNLLLAGLKITSVGGLEYLAVANKHVGLQKIFQDTSWGTREGLEGGWSQEMRRIPGHIVPAKALWFGNASRAVLVPMSLCVPPMRDSSPAGAQHQDKGDTIPFDPDDDPRPADV